MRFADVPLFAYNNLFGAYPKRFSRRTSQDNMATHYSALKRARQTEKRTARNRPTPSALRGVLPSFRKTPASTNRKPAEAGFRETVSAIDKAIQKGVLHANTAARYKSRLSARLSKIAK